MIILKTIISYSEEIYRELANVMCLIWHIKMDKGNLEGWLGCDEGKETW